MNEKEINIDFSCVEKIVAEVKTYVLQSVKEGSPVHTVEKYLYQKMFEIGHNYLKGFFSAQGTGNLGKELTMPDGTVVTRLDGSFSRTYRSVFGNISFERTAYGRGKKPK